MSTARRTRLTGRGAALAATGAVAAVAGTLLGVSLLAQVAALLLLTVVGGVGWVALESIAEQRGGLRTVRHVPPWAQPGVPATVRVELTATGRQRVDRLRISERASAELSGQDGLRARVRRSAERLELTYQIQPRRRGRWPLGPLEVRRTDPFGVARRRGSLGSPALVAVRPVVVPLDHAAWSSAAEADQVAAGSRRPAADDAALREYLPGDDLRRVHWASSARRGTLVVRQDERSARRPVTVVLDLAPVDAETEWTISAAASLAVALTEAGHRVRLLGGGRQAAGEVDALLDHTVDLERPPDEATADAWLVAAVDELATHRSGPTGLVVAVLRPQHDLALRHLGVTPGWALVTGASHDPARQRRTVDSLNRAGWTAVAVAADQDVATAWRGLAVALGPAR